MRSPDDAMSEQGLVHDPGRHPPYNWLKSDPRPPKPDCLRSKSERRRCKSERRPPNPSRDRQGADLRRVSR